MKKPTKQQQAAIEEVKRAYSPATPPEPPAAEAMGPERTALFETSDVVYISGPMTNRPLCNHPKFFGLAGLIEKMYGCRVLNPARRPLGLSYARYMEFSLADIRQATAVVQLRGWKTSRGACAECLEALQHNLRIIDEESLLAEIADIMEELVFQ